MREEETETSGRNPVAGLIASAPDTLGPSTGAFIGLIEAAAWVASRDSLLCAAVAHHLALKPDERRTSDSDGSRLERLANEKECRLGVWLTLMADCQNVYRADVEAALAEIMQQCATDCLKGKGRSGGGGFDDIPANDWLEASYTPAEPDAIEPAGPLAGIFTSPWTHIRFLRAAVEALWPDERRLPKETEHDSRECGLSRKGTVRDDTLKEWAERLIADGVTARQAIERRKTAFPDHEVPSKRRVEWAYGEAFKSAFGEPPRSGGIHPLLKRNRENAAP